MRLPAVLRDHQRTQDLQRFDALLAEPYTVQNRGALLEIGEGEESLHLSSLRPRTKCANCWRAAVRVLT